MSVFIIYSSLTRFIVPPEIAIGLAQIPLIPNLVRSIYLFEKARKLNKTSESPMVKSYYINFKVTTIIDVSVLASLSAVFVLASLGMSQIALVVDPVVSAVLGLYMLYCGAKLTIGNFKVLIDYPLAEEDQLKIMGVLSKEFASYENIGNIYTRFSGKTRFIEVELFFKKEVFLKEITTIKQEIEAGLQAFFPDLRFVLIPLCEPDLPPQVTNSDCKNETVSDAIPVAPAILPKSIESKELNP